MGVFTFVCRVTDGHWSAKQLNGELEGSAGSNFDLQRHLAQAALSANSSVGVQSRFSYVTPSSAVFQVIVGGSVGGGATPWASGGDAAADAPAVEEKKEEKEESEENDNMFSLFD